MSTQLIQSRPEFLGILRDQETFHSEKAGVGNDINGWFDRLMIQSGWRIAPSAVLALCVLLGMAVGGGVFVLQENLLTAALAFVIGSTIPVLIAVAMRSQPTTRIESSTPRHDRRTRPSGTYRTQFGALPPNGGQRYAGPIGRGTQVVHQAH